MTIEEFQSRARLDDFSGSSFAPAVVLGAGPTALSVTRALSRRGIPVFALDEPTRLPTRHSNSFILLESENFFHAETVVKELIEIGRRLPAKPVLFCSGDEHVLIVARNQKRLAEHFLFEMPSPHDTNVLMRKDLFTPLAERRGWPVPKTVRIGSAEALDQLHPLQYPVIVKPALKTRKIRENAPTKTVICADAVELRDAYCTLAQWEPQAIIQEWIPGADDQIYFTFHYLTEKGVDLGGFAGRKIRQYPPHGGSTAFAEPVVADGLMSLSLEILRGSGVRGFCSVEYKYDARNGEYVIMEPTVGRVNLQVGLALANGCDYVSAAYGSLTGLIDRKQCIQRSDTKRRWMLVPQDLRSARYYIRRGDLTLIGYLKSFLGAVCVHPLSLRDPGVTLSVLWNIFREIVVGATRWIGREKKQIRGTS